MFSFFVAIDNHSRSSSPLLAIIVFLRLSRTYSVTRHAKSLKNEIALLEEQNNDAAEKVDDEAKPSDTDADANATEPISSNDGLDGKPDINDVPMEESQAPDNSPLTRQDLNESTLDLSLG